MEKDVQLRFRSTFDEKLTTMYEFHKHQEELIKALNQYKFLISGVTETGHKINDIIKRMMINTDTANEAWFDSFKNVMQLQTDIEHQRQTILEKGFSEHFKTIPEFLRESKDILQKKEKKSKKTISQFEQQYERACKKSKNAQKKKQDVEKVEAERIEMEQIVSKKRDLILKDLLYLQKTDHSIIIKALGKYIKQQNLYITTISSISNSQLSQLDILNSTFDTHAALTTEQLSYVYNTSKQKTHLQKKMDAPQRKPATAPGPGTRDFPCMAQPRPPSMECLPRLQNSFPPVRKPSHLGRSPVIRRRATYGGAQGKEISSELNKRNFDGAQNRNAEMVKPSVTNGWKEAIDEFSGLTYVYNEETGESKWAAEH